jgi:hypothetical protein
MCKSIYDASPEDSLIDSWSRPDENNKYIELVNGALHDPIIKRIPRKCPKCNHPNMKLLLLGTSETVAFICPNVECETNASVGTSSDSKKTEIAQKIDISDSL